MFWLLTNFIYVNKIIWAWGVKPIVRCSWVRIAILRLHQFWAWKCRFYGTLQVLFFSLVLCLYFIFRKVQSARNSVAYLDHVWRSFKVNALGGLALTNIFKPLLDNGALKRLCFVSSEVSCISMMNRERGFAYPMSKSSLNMAVRMIHNDLYGQGYTVRLFHPGWMKRVMLDGSRVEGPTVDPDDSAEFAVRYFTEPLLDEHRLVMVDYLGNEWPY